MDKKQLKNGVVIAFHDDLVGEIRNVRQDPEISSNQLYDIFIFEEQKLSEGFSLHSKTTESAKILSEEEIRTVLNQIMVHKQTGIEAAESRLERLKQEKSSIENWLEQRWENQVRQE